MLSITRNLCAFLGAPRLNLFGRKIERRRRYRDALNPPIKSLLPFHVFGLDLVGDSFQLLQDFSEIRNLSQPAPLLQQKLFVELGLQSRLLAFSTLELLHQRNDFRYRGEKWRLVPPHLKRPLDRLWRFARKHAVKLSRQQALLVQRDLRVQRRQMDLNRERSLRSR